MEKRLNPATGQLFKYGDEREDGYRFKSYTCSKKGQNGYVAEHWLSPVAYENQIKNNKNGMVRLYRERREAITKIKIERGCADCGYNANPVALQYDHIPGTEKRFDIGECTRALSELLKEIEKCEVVCANCHAIRTHARRENTVI